MKQFLWTLFLIPGLAFAQEDAKYMRGAVPEKDGKVVFSRELNLPGQSQEQIYRTLKQWAENYFVPKEQFQSRVLYSNPEEGQIVAQGQEYLVFTDKVLSLDRALTTYQMFMECAPDKCNLKITAIRYLYNTGGKPEVIRAEDQITDKYTLNKAGTKLIKATGKFRTHTIDMAERLFTEASAAVGVQTQQAQTLAGTAYPAAQPAPAPSPATLTASLPATTTTTPQTLAGYKQIDPQKIPGNIIDMLMDDWMLITAGQEAQFNMMTASWGGLGHLYGKPVTFCFINPTRYTYRLMENGDTYTLSFYTETYREALKYCGSNSGRDQDKVKGSGLTPLTTPSGAKAFAEAWMIIECKKLVSQSFTPEALANEQLREKWAGKQLHKMYIGEILNVWVK